jgi:mono/diheme cytochrome c family protein
MNNNLKIVIFTVLSVGIGVFISASFFFVETGQGVIPTEFRPKDMDMEEVNFRTKKAAEINSSIRLTLSDLNKKGIEPQEIQKLENTLMRIESNTNKLKQILPENENNILIKNSLALLSKEKYPDLPRSGDIANKLGELEIYWEPDLELVEKGRVLYKRHCATCHSLRGDGVPVTPEALKVAPRDFTGSTHFVRQNTKLVNDGVVTFKYSSAEKGPALREDIIDTIKNGLPGTPMPGFPGYTDEEIESVADYIMTFGYLQWKFGVKPNQEISELKIPNDLTQAFANKDFDLISDRIQKGRTLYKAACFACHSNIEDLGKKAVGLSAETSWLGADGKPITTIARNFASEPFKKGSPRQLYRTIRMGIKGTPMPPHLFAQEQIWDLVSYVMFLQDKFAENEIK